MDKKKFEQAIGFTLISAAFLSIYGLFVKIGLKELSVWSLTFMRFFIPLVLSLPYLWWNGTLRRLFPLNNLRLQFLRASCVVIAQAAMIYYLTKASLLDATIMWGTGPLFIPILSHFLHGAKILKVTYISILLSFIGVGLILKPGHGIFDPFIIFGLLSGIGMAFSQVLYGANVEKGSVSENLFYLFFFCSILTFVPFLLSEKWNYDLHADALTVGSMAGVAFASLSNQVFRGLAYMRAPPPLLTPFLYVSLVISALFDWLFFNILTVDFLSLLGFLLVLYGSYLKWRWGRGL